MAETPASPVTPPSPDRRRPYVPPAFETEPLFETNGLACAKCETGIIDDPYSCGIVAGGPPNLT